MKTLSLLADALGLGRTRPGINVLRVASAVLHGETVTFGARVFQVMTIPGGSVPEDRIKVDLSASPTAAAAARVLTFSGTATDTQTVTIGARVYTFKTALSGAANEVLIGANLTASRDNLVAAINGAAGAGTTYGTGTVAHADVSAAPSSTDALTATAKAKGTAGNAIATTETLTNAAWAGATLTGGVDPTAAEFTTALETVANVTGNVGAVRVSANEVLFLNWRADATGANIACTETLSGANNGWAAAATYGNQGEMFDAFPKITLFTRQPNAQEVTLGNLHILLSFAPKAFLIQVRGSDGILKAWNGVASQPNAGKRITLDNSGNVDWAATDTITVFASE